VRKRKQIGKAERQTIIGRYRASGLSQKAFCEREGLNFHSLQWWIYHCKTIPEGRPVTMTAPRLLPVTVSQVVANPPTAQGRTTIDVTIESGFVVRFSEDNDSAYMTRLLLGLAHSGDAC
jgi:hypothetical protein